MRFLERFTIPGQKLSRRLPLCLRRGVRG
uniref:Uncharacterized protein n=1 Tax=Rhizophora mucronata TaxID=61149 RepID=A0A2P2JPG1_RHIMU